MGDRPASLASARDRGGPRLHVHPARRWSSPTRSTRAAPRPGRQPASPRVVRRRAAQNTGLRDAFLTSVGVALAATVVALVLGTLAGARGGALQLLRPRDDLVHRPVPDRAAGHRDRHGAVDDLRDDRLPAGFARDRRRPRHVLRRARLQQRDRPPPARVALLEEASADLGADTFQTFRRVTFPAMRTAMLAGSLLAFALSFDEVIVTIFIAGGVKTLPIWIFQSFRLANQVALVNVAGHGGDPAVGDPGLPRVADQLRRRRARGRPRLIARALTSGARARSGRPAPRSPSLRPSVDGPGRPGSAGRRRPPIRARATARRACESTLSSSPAGRAVDPGRRPCRVPSIDAPGGCSLAGAAYLRLISAGRVRAGSAGED